MPLNSDQTSAIESILEFLRDPSAGYFFLLEGPAGTGKTYCIQELVNRRKGRFIFTAPTNKATKILRSSMSRDGYRPECRTIYSLLGLRLEANGEIKEIAAPSAEEIVDLTDYEAVIVDEASMVNAQLSSFIRQTAEEQGVKFIFMGDPSQLPPVKELHSPIWSMADAKASLHQIMRYDNQILQLATEIRGLTSHPAPSIKFASNNDGEEGVWKLPSPEFHASILNFAGRGLFSSADSAKAIAWRNLTVDELNRKIRQRIFENAAESFWLPDDRLTLLEPARDLDGTPIAHTDDEGKVDRVFEDEHPLHREFKIWRVTVTLEDNRVATLRLLHPDSVREHRRRLDSLVEEAKRDRRKWKAFWNFKDSFHTARHAYAITAHRSQGSTYESVFVDWRDILANPNRSEAFRCLYVACTRPRKRLFLGG